MRSQIPFGHTIVGKCSLCGGMVTCPEMWMGIPPKSCIKCGAEPDETKKLRTIPMVKRPDKNVRSNPAWKWSKSWGS